MVSRLSAILQPALVRSTNHRPSHNRALPSASDQTHKGLEERPLAWGRVLLTVSAYWGLKAGVLACTIHLPVLCTPPLLASTTQQHPCNLLADSPAGACSCGGGWWRPPSICCAQARSCNCHSSAHPSARGSSCHTALSHTMAQPARGERGNCGRLWCGLVARTHFFCVTCWDRRGKKGRLC